MTRTNLSKFILAIAVIGFVGRGLADDAHNDPQLGATMTAINDDFDYIKSVTKAMPVTTPDQIKKANKAIQVAILRTKVIEFLFQSIRDNKEGTMKPVEAIDPNASPAAVADRLKTYDKDLSAVQSKLEEIRNNLIALAAQAPADRKFDKIKSDYEAIVGATQNDPNSLKFQGHVTDKFHNH